MTVGSASGSELVARVGIIARARFPYRGEYVRGIASTLVVRRRPSQRHRPDIGLPFAGRNPVGPARLAPALVAARPASYGWPTVPGLHRGGGAMNHPGPSYPTRLAELLARGHQTHEEAVAAFNERARQLGEPATLSVRQLDRWLKGRLSGLPRPTACRVAEALWGEPVEQLLSPPAPPAT